MVERVAQEFSLQSPGTPGYSGVNLGAGNYRPQEVETSIADQALHGLMGVTEKVAGQLVDRQAQQAYLDGARARMVGEAEASVDSDIFSRPFVRGGYQDEDYRLDQVEMERELTTFIEGDGQRMEPGEFAKIMRERAGKYEKKFTGLSMSGQLQALSSQQSMEQALLTKQTQAYQSWSISEFAKRRTAQGNQIMTGLAKASDPAERQARIEQAGVFYLGLMTDDKLPAESRAQLGNDFLTAMVNMDQREVVEQLRDGGALDGLSFEQRKELDTALRKSAARTEARDALGVVMANGDFEAAVERGDVTVEQLEGYIVAETKAGRMSYDQAKSLRMRYVSGMANKDGSLAVIQALGARNITALAAAGHTPESGLLFMDKQLAAQGVPVISRLQQGLSIGLDLGTIPKAFGETVGASVRAVQLADPNQPLNTELVDVLNATVQTLTLAENKNPGRRGALLASLPEDTRSAMAHLLQQQQYGVNPVQALKEFAANKEAYTKLSALEQGIKKQGFKTKVTELIDSNLGSGFFGRIGNAVTGQASLNTNPEEAAMLAGHVEQELSFLVQDRNNMGATPEALLDVAMANVEARTIDVGAGVYSNELAIAAGVGGGPEISTDNRRSRLVLPRGVDMAQVFGTNDKAGIARELYTQMPPKVDGFNAAYRYSREGGLELVQVDANGIIADRQKVDPRAVGAKVEAEKMRILREEEAAHFGGPVEVGGQTVALDGGNSYGIPVRLAHTFRRELAQMEGLSLTVYKDRNGLAAGLGRNVTGMGYKEGDQISKDQAETWFREDTDKAMAYGKRASQSLGVIDPRATLALSGAIYQLGNAGLDAHKNTLAAIRAKDYNRFISEVRSSEWAQQTPNRAEWFITNMAGHFLP